MMKRLRGMLRPLLEAVPTQHAPTLRRCDDPSALLATNLPFLADESAVLDFIHSAETQGWMVTPRNGWLLLDHDVSILDMPVPDAPRGEIGCLISLLVRHPQDTSPCQDELRALVKSAEVSAEALEQLCGQLHRQWAEKLRRHTPLPGGLLPCLCELYHQLYCDKEVTP